MPHIIFESILIFLVIFSCLAYGSVTISPITIIETVSGFLILFWLAQMLYKRTLSFVKTGFYAPIILFLCLVIFQLIPLPLNLMRIISTKTAYLYENFISHTALRMFFPLSIYPNATISELLKVLTYTGIFFLIINKIETKKQINFIINTIIFFGAFISIFGIVQKYTHSGRVYWFDPAGSATAAFGPFVNRNNFVGYINMIIPLALGYFLSEMPLAKRVIYGSCVGIMSLALFLALSRAGILVYIVVLLSMLILSRFKESLKTKTKTLSIWILLVLCSFISFVDIKVVGERLATLFQKETLAIFGHGYSWLDILRIWQDFPIFGTGLGTFGSISSMYKTAPLQNLFTYAHNDYLQLLSEMGLLGFIFISLFFILYFKSVLKMWLKRHDSYVVCLVLGGIASILGILVYSLLDFNLHITANALLFFMILGLVYRLAYTRFSNAIYK